MTSPKEQPEAAVTDAVADEQAQDQAEIQATQYDAGSDSDSEAAPVTSTKSTTGTRRRSAALEVRGGRRRGGAAIAAAAAEPAEGEVVAKKGTNRTSRGSSSRTARSSGTTGTRSGTRAQQRAARTATGEAAKVAEVAPLEEAVVVAQAETVESAVQSPEVIAVEPEATPAPTAVEMVVTPPPAPPIEVAPAAVPAEPAAGDDADEEASPAPTTRRRAPAKPEKRSSRTTKTEPAKSEPAMSEPARTEENKNDASHYVVAPTVRPAQMQPRHYGVIVSFFLLVLVPTLSYSWYIWTRAADQYQSDVGFGSRTEEAGSTFDFLGALGGTAQSGSKDMDILNEFIVSQELVAKVDAQVDLRAMYTKPENDPLNALNPNGTIEDLVKYWQRMVLVNYNDATGLMNLEVFAFDPADAKKIAEVVLVESTNIINELSKTAQDDITRYSKEALAATEAKLAEARLAVLDFQIKNQIVDPSNVIGNQLSVVSTLNQQLAGAQIELDMIAGTVPEKDPRIALLHRRIEVIQNRIAEEKSKVGVTADSNSPGYAKLMADFERLKVDLDFAQRAYLSALAAHDQALTDAQHKTRYLSTYVAPTLAESSTAPNRPLTAFLVALISFILWAVIVLVYYALRDRR